MDANPRTCGFLRAATAVAALAILAATACAPMRRRPRPIDPTPVPAVEAVRLPEFEELHGHRIRDPYRWLEEPDTAQSRTWIAEQNRRTEKFLARTSRDDIRGRLVELWDYEKWGVPRAAGGRYFVTLNTGLQNQSALYVLDGLNAPPRVLVDPNKLAMDGTVSLSGWTPSPDGQKLAYALSSGGSDWREWRVIDVATGVDLPDLIRWVKFSGIEWTRDSQGFYYSRYDAPAAGEELRGANFFQKLHFHRLGTPQEDDPLIYERKDEKTWGFGAQATEDGRWLVIPVWRGSSQENAVFYLDLAKPESGVRELLNRWDATYEFIGNDGDTFWFKTTKDAPFGRIVAVGLDDPSPEKWSVIVKERADTLRDVSYVGGRFICEYLAMASSRVLTYAPDGTFTGEVDLPEIGSAHGFGGEGADQETFFVFSSFATPPVIYRLDMTTTGAQVFRTPKVNMDETQDYVVEQVKVPSKDGTEVPMFLVRRSDVAPDGRRPTYMKGYGGFNIAITPRFSPSDMLWLEKGGLVAVPNLRGGGEFGEEWHQAGMKSRKQNVFDDFIACAEWLVRNRWTSSDRLAIAGGSNGGLLVGACMTQRPELFRVCLPDVGVHDMLRFHKFTIGWAWQGEYGSPDVLEDFLAIKAYSPLHNVKPGTCYPATLVTTADHDDRVVPAHSFKFAAALQAAQGCANPILIRIETKAGHGAGTATSKLIEKLADQWAFTIQMMELDY